MAETTAKIIDGKAIIDLGDDARAGKVKRIELNFEGDDKVTVEEFLGKPTKVDEPPAQPEKPKSRFFKTK